MLDWLQDIWTGIKDLPFLLADLVVGIINAFIVAIAALAKALVALLPGFPNAPSAPEGVLGVLWWVFPVEAGLAFFMLMVGAWITFLAVKVGLRWVKAL